MLTVVTIKASNLLCRMASAPIIRLLTVVPNRENPNILSNDLEVDGIGKLLHHKAPNSFILPRPLVWIARQPVKNSKHFGSKRSRGLGASFLVPVKRRPHIALCAWRYLDGVGLQRELNQARNSSNAIAVVRPALISSLRLLASATQAWVISSSGVPSPCRLSKRDNATNERSSGSSAKAFRRT